MAFSFRPNFALDVDGPNADLVERLATELASMPVQLRRTRVPGGGESGPARRDHHLVITVLPDERHFWSPWLTIDVEPSSSRAKLSATFSPHPSLWTGYLFGYLGLGIVVLFSLIFAGSVAMTGGSSLWSLWVAGGALGCMIAAWWASVIGQRLAAAQMTELRGAVERAVSQLAQRR